MSTQTIRWIALPNGVANGKLKLSVFVSPRLVPNAATNPTLGSPAAGFPDFLNWPAAISNIKFDVTFGNGQTFTNIPRSSALPRADLWTALFHAQTPVTPFMFREVNRYVRSYPAPTVRDTLKTAYRQTALASPSTPPKITDLGYIYYGIFEELFALNGFSMIYGVNEQTRAEIDGLLAVGGTAPDGEEYRTAIGVVDLENMSPGAAMAQVELFHDRTFPPSGLLAPKDGGPHVPAVPKLDFHTALTSLGDYPGLLRLMGLVFDILVPLPTVTGDTTVSVAPTPGSYHPAAGPTYEPISPLTRCTLGANRFATGPLDGGVVAPGYVALRDGHEVIEFDVDGAALKAMKFNEMAFRNQQNLNGVSTTTSRDGGSTLFPPALRGAGLAVAQIDRAGLLSNALDRANDLHGPGTLDALDKADVTKGYVVDVWNDHDNAWHTLCARVGTYHFLNGNRTVKLTDEASTRLAATSQPGPYDDLYLHEIIFRWDGWSLAAPRPGKAVMPDSAGGQTVGTAKSEADPDFPLETSFVPVAGSLPRLRYGLNYRFRARAVDIAGNAVPLGAASTDFAGTGATDPVRYTRFEPVATPFVLPRKPKTAGESPERLVIRSNYNVAAAADAERHIAPAKVSELMAEQHGLWDASTGKPKSTDYAKIAKYDAGSYDTLGALDPNGGGTRFYDVNNPGVPYIPDPLARGALLQDLPGQPAGGMFKVPFAKPTGLGQAPTSPFVNGYSFRVAVVEGSGAPAFNPSNRVLTVQLPKAAVRVVKLSSYVNAADLPLIGFWSWLEQDPPPGGLAAQQQLIVDGKQFMVTPYRELVLVHAVKQPLAAPAFTHIGVARDPAKTFATLTDTINFNRPSTQKLDIVGSWNEYLDVPNTAPDADPTDNPPGATPSSARVVELTAAVDDPAGNTIKLDNRHEFGDTKHRWVNYSAIATTRFQDYFVQRANVTLASAPTIISTPGIVDKSDVVRNVNADPELDSQTTYTRDVDYAVDYNAGTIKALKPALVGASVHVDYVPPPVTRTSTEVPLPAAVDIPSSARPTAPKVAYVVPTFGWESSTNLTGQTSKRTGNGLRVYLERSWWSSGQDEQLGVIVPPSGSSAQTPESLLPYVTSWGADPIWRTGNTAPVVTTAGFPLATAPATNVKLAETGASVNVAPHDVAYDEQRGLWYADIVVDAGKSYSPFVRLALARYQKHSLADLELSNVVLAEFTKLSPDRGATIVYSGNPTKVNVKVTGPAYRGSQAALDTRSIVTVVVETKVAGMDGELSWTASALPEVVFTGSVPDSDGISLWSGDVTLPKSRGQGPMRLVVREFEIYAVNPVAPLQLDATKGRRVVYVDTIEI